MNKAEFKVRTHNLLHLAYEQLQTTADRLIDSGALDIDSCDMGHVKVVVHAALKDVAASYRPLSSGYRNDAENLSHF